MLTTCPSCERKFRIYARQLTAAQGLVQCGFCGEKFNALDCLSDLPYAAKHEAPPKKLAPGAGHQEEPQFIIPVASPDWHTDEKTQTGAGRLDRILDDQDLTNDLMVPAPAARSRIVTLLWSFGLILLLVLIAAQLAWFNRDQLLARYPQLIPPAKQFCQRWQCELTRERDLTSMIVLARDVRDHPRYNDALLVNITIENQSDLIQPYPGIQLTLFDDNGAITGYRRLQASEYLDEEMPLDEGFSPRVPLHLVLELADTIAGTVGFEFGFF